MTLAELARRAGVWVETVQLFIQRGVLPAAGQGGKFDQQHLDIVRFVGRMQAEHHLALDTIAPVLVQQCSFDLDRAEEALSALVEPDPTRAGPGPTTRARLLEVTSAPPDLVEGLEAADLLPSQGPYGGHHVWIVEAALELRAAGLDDTHIRQIGRLGLEIATTEVDAVVYQVGRGARPAEALARTRDRRSAVGRLVSVARHGATRQLMAELAKASDRSKQLALESVHVPSRLFMARYRLDAVLQDLQQQVEALTTGEVTSLDASPLREHGRLLLGVGRFAESARALRTAVGHPVLAGDGETWATLALSLALAGQDEEALEAAEAAAGMAPSSPRVHVYRAGVLAMLAGRAGDLLLATARVHDALNALEQSRQHPSQSTVEAIEVRLTRGRICTLMPAAFGVQAKGLADLRQVLADTEDAGDEALGFDVPGSRDLVRLNALFYLGLALTDAGRAAEAEPLLREVIALDPVSAYATRAYQRLHG